MFKVSEVSRNVHVIDYDFKKSGEEFRILLTADRHWDNPDSDRDMQKKHLDQARKYGAAVIDVGDLFCAMQGKYDKRSNKSKVRPEHQNEKYLDSLVETGADWFLPYQDLITVMAQGNHETAILKNHETNLTERLVERLNTKSSSGKKTYMGGYGGFVRLKFKNGSHRNSILINYHHGHGGGGEVTKGVLQSFRRAVFMPDPDIVISGHIHESYIFPIEQLRICEKNVIKRRTQYHVRIPTYKDEYKDGYGGWQIETGKPPKPIGAWWLIIKPYLSSGGYVTFDINFEMAR